MGILDRIQEIETEIARTQKNKATNYHLGTLKAKLAKYRAELLEPTGKKGDKGEGFEVLKVWFRFKKKNISQILTNSCVPSCFM